MAKTPRPLSFQAKAALARLREFTDGWDGLEERLSFGHPALRARGKAFAVLDHYQDADCLWLQVPAEERSGLLATPGWFAAPYDPRRTALCIRLDAVDWRRVRTRVRISYALAAVPKSRAARR
jgi:predicted DNA-binding protein (MmcQ/YjbR family)